MSRSYDYGYGFGMGFDAKKEAEYLAAFRKWWNSRGSGARPDERDYGLTYKEAQELRDRQGFGIGA